MKPVKTKKPVKMAKSPQSAQNRRDAFRKALRAFDALVWRCHPRDEIL